jgi:hypothetical protein
MNLFWILPLIVTVAFAVLAAVVSNFVGNSISKTRRTFEIRAKDGRKVTFEVGEDEDLSTVVSSQVRRLEQQEGRQEGRQKAY